MEIDPLLIVGAVLGFAIWVLLGAACLYGYGWSVGRKEAHINRRDPISIGAAWPQPPITLGM